MILVTGLPDTGFEKCDATQQTLTRGSQYQMSFLPAMQNGQIYQVKVKASYKDYLPLEFILNVKYIPSLDLKSYFVDLGTHVFYKTNAKRSLTNFKFSMHSVTDNKVSDDLSDFTIALRDGMLNNIYQVDEQENVVDVGSEFNLPRIGLNTVEASSTSNLFYPASRSFHDLKGQTTNVEIPLVSKLKDGELAVVMTWSTGSKAQANNQVLQSDLQLHVEFEP
jgi:hypothetical protein